MMVTFSSVRDPQLAQVLLAGNVGVIPTDTIYGLAAVAADHQAVARLYALKHRERKPGTVIAASADQLINLGLDKKTVDAVAHVWPNPLSIVISASASLGYLDQGLGDVAVRVPNDAILQDLLRRTGPLLTSSANHPGQPPAETLAQARSYFGDNVDFYVEGGDRAHRPASTVVRYTNGRFEVLRPGAVVISEQGNIADMTGRNSG